MDMHLQELKSVDRNRVKAFFCFDLMVLPWLVKVMFVLGLIGIFVAGALLPFKAATGIGFGPEGLHSEFHCGTFAIFTVVSVLFMVIGMVWWRVVCESMIILFKIHEVLAPKRPEAPKPAGPELAAGKAPEPPPAGAPPAPPAPPAA
jgi:hypothetical protein